MGSSRLAMGADRSALRSRAVWSCFLVRPYLILMPQSADKCLSLPKSVSCIDFGNLAKSLILIQLAPSESYNYHPLLPPSDPENPIAEETCSICMDPVDTRPGPSGEVLLGINPRRAYALAPCHHLFHTKCLAQWVAVKVSERFFHVLMEKC